MIEEFLDFIRSKLEEKEVAREELLKLVREMRINSTKAIASIHAGDFKKADEYLKNAMEILQKVREYKRYPDVYYPVTFDAMQELVEAYVFRHVVENYDIDVDLSKLDVEFAPILTGLADAVGEIRRHILDLLRKNEFDKAEKLIGIMERIYNNLITFSFPDKITPNLRPKVDYVRNAIERTKSDFISAKASALREDVKSLEEIVKKLRQSLKA
ncbi:translin [Archaeoglobus sp.]